MIIEEKIFFALKHYFKFKEEFNQILNDIYADKQKKFSNEETTLTEIIDSHYQKFLSTHIDEQKNKLKICNKSLALFEKDYLSDIFFYLIAIRSFNVSNHFSIHEEFYHLWVFRFEEKLAEWDKKNNLGETDVNRDAFTKKITRFFNYKKLWEFIKENFDTESFLGESKEDAFGNFRKYICAEDKDLPLYDIDDVGEYDPLDARKIPAQTEDGETTLHELWKKVKIAEKQLDIWDKTYKDRDKTIVKIELLEKMKSEKDFIVFLSQNIIDSIKTEYEVGNFMKKLGPTLRKIFD